MPRYCRRHRVSLLGNLVFGGLLLISLGFLFSQRLQSGSSGGPSGGPSGRSGGPGEQDGLLEGADFFLATQRPVELVDWHNWSQISVEQRRRGPGEHGAAVYLKEEEKAEADRLYKVNGYNAAVSDKISVRRALRDIRHPTCKTQKYRRQLPTASIIVPFHQEHWSTLLRTFVTALVRAPAHLVKEVILVDDHSSKEFLKTPLERYLRASGFADRVRVIRAEKRQGLIRARILGAQNATGDVLVFLDSHCEANVNWLPPLLDPIAADYRTVVCPLIDIVDYDTFEYRAQDDGARGSFDWEFFYKRVPLLPRDLAAPGRPFESPVMAGGLFAISRKWFWELGGYDPGLDIWGGEQYELSFKVWQCGGRLLDAPCSRVGHVYRKFAPFPNDAKGDFVGRNYRRVAEVWMDEYKEYIYQRRPRYRKIDPGDLTQQRAVRERLRCKPFSWYMDRVAFDLKKYYPPVEPRPAARGSLRWLEDTRFCLDSRFGKRGEEPALALCVEDSPDGRTGEQNFTLTYRRDVRTPARGLCLDVPENRAGAPVILFPCHGFKGNQWWKFDPKRHQMRHVVSEKCLQAEAASKRVLVMPCDTKVVAQQWAWSHTEEKLVKQYLSDEEEA